MSKPNVIIVGSHDEPIGKMPRSNVKQNDIYRVSALWLTDNETNDILIAQRSQNKKNDPGNWSAAAAGTVEAGETYEENIVKETAEELGLYNLKVSLGPKQLVKDDKNTFFCQWFYASAGSKSVHVTLQEDEVEAVKWTTIPWLQADLKANPQSYTPSMPKNVQLLTK